MLDGGWGCFIRKWCEKLDCSVPLSGNLLVSSNLTGCIRFMSGLLVYPIFWLLWRPPHKFLVFVVFFLPSYNLGSSQGYPRPNTFGPGVANIQNFYCLTQDLPVMKQHQMKSQRYSMICKLGEVEGEHICASCSFSSAAKDKYYSCTSYHTWRTMIVCVLWWKYSHAYK